MGRLFDRVGFWMFGQRAPDGDTVWFVPGNGGLGGTTGGQVPPVVPYSADWDPSERHRRERDVRDRDRRRARSDGTG